MRITLAVIGLMFLVNISACNSCNEQIEKTIPSSDNMHEVQLCTLNCGATVKWVTLIKVLDRKTKKSTVVYKFYGLPCDVEANWSDINKLHLIVPSFDAFKKEDRAGMVLINYEKGFVGVKRRIANKSNDAEVVIYENTINGKNTTFIVLCKPVGKFDLDFLNNKNCVPLFIVEKGNEVVTVDWLSPRKLRLQSKFMDENVVTPVKTWDDIQVEYSSQSKLRN